MGIKMRKNLIYYFISFFLCLLFANPILYSEKNRKKTGMNFLLITIDTLRADRLSCYSREHLETPNIDSLAEIGILFTRAFAHTSTTLPSHANILLGTVPLYHGVHDNSNFVVQKDFLTLARHLKSFGYSTGAFVGAYPLDSRFGLTQGFDVYDDDYGSQNFQEPSYVERRAEVVIDSALKWLKRQKPPWFLWMHCFDPHIPYESPEPFRTQYKETPYNGEVAYIDSTLGKLFNYLKDNNFFDNTLIIFTGDHGESLWEHGEITHGYFAYNSSIWIPLIISVPGVKARKVFHQVSHIDIFPTVCDVLNIKKPSFLQGISLLPSIKGKKLPKRPIYFESMYPYYSRGWAPIRGFIYDDEKFIDSPIPELYDLDKDFDELKNLAETESLENYQKQLARIIKDQSFPEVEPGLRKKIDRKSLEKLKSLGYISSTQVTEKKSFSPEDDVKILLPYHNKTMEAVDIYKRGKVRESIRILKEVITEREDVDVSYTNLALIYKEQGRLMDAIDVLKLGFKQLPSSYEIFLTYVSYLLNEGQYDEVIEVFGEKSLHRKEYDPEIWNSLGAAYANKGDFEEAIKAYQKALSLDNDYPLALNNLGTVYLSIFLKTKDRKAYEKSLQNFKKAIELNPNYASAYNGLGGAYLQAGNLDGAVQCFEKAVEINPDLGNALYNLGLAYLEKSEKSKALLYFTRYKDKYDRFLSPSGKKKLEELIQKCKQE